MIPGDEDPARRGRRPHGRRPPVAAAPNQGPGRPRPADDYSEVVVVGDMATCRRLAVPVTVIEPPDQAKLAGRGGGAFRTFVTIVGAARLAPAYVATVKDAAAWPPLPSSCRRDAARHRLASAGAAFRRRRGRPRPARLSSPSTWPRRSRSARWSWRPGAPMGTTDGGTVRARRPPTPASLFLGGAVEMCGISSAQRLRDDRRRRQRSRPGQDVDFVAADLARCADGATGAVLEVLAMRTAISAPGAPSRTSSPRIDALSDQVHRPVQAGQQQDARRTSAASAG